MIDQTTDDRKESHKLVQELKRMIGDPVNIRVLGDWMFSGILVSVRCDLVILTDVTVISASGLTIGTFDVDSVTINLEALTSVGKPAEIINGNGG